MTTLRTFTNRPGITYDADKTSVIFAEDMNEIKSKIETLESAELAENGEQTVTGNKLFSGIISIGKALAGLTSKLNVMSSFSMFRSDTEAEVFRMTVNSNGVNYDMRAGNSNGRHIWSYGSNATEVMRTSADKVGIGQNTPTAYLHLKAGGTGTNTACLKFATGSLLSTPETGAFEFEGTKLYFTIAGVRKEVAFV
jgi:hypothetical protein